MSHVQLLFFALALASYFLGSVFFLTNLFLKDERLARTSMRIAVAGVTFHTVSLVARGLEHQAVPFTTAGEGWSFLSWAVVSIFLSISGRSALRSMGAMALPAALFGLLIAGVESQQNPSPLLVSIPTWELLLHVPASVLSLGAITVAFLCSVSYLIQDYWIRQKRGWRMWGALPSLHALDATSYWLGAVGFCLLTVGMVSGMVLAQRSWSSEWLAHPKMLASLLLWLTYAGYLYVRGVAHWHGARLHRVVVALVVMATTVYGVLVAVGWPHSG